MYSICKGVLTYSLQKCYSPYKTFDFKIQLQQLRLISNRMLERGISAGCCCNNKLINTPQHPITNSHSHLFYPSIIINGICQARSRFDIPSAWPHHRGHWHSNCMCSWACQMKPNSVANYVHPIRSSSSDAPLSPQLSLSFSPRTRCVCVIWLPIARVTWRAFGELFCCTVCVACFDCDYFGHMEKFMTSAVLDHCVPWEEMEIRSPCKISPAAVVKMALEMHKMRNCHELFPLQLLQLC